MWYDKGMSDKNVYIMMGIPGGGKSTWIRNNVPSDAVICSADHFFEDANDNYSWKAELLFPAHKTCFRKYIKALDNPYGHNVVVDNTNTKRAFMQDYVHEANLRGIDVTIVTIVADPAVAALRNVHGVPAETVNKMHNELLNTLKIGFSPDWGIKQHIMVGH